VEGPLFALRFAVNLDAQWRDLSSRDSRVEQSKRGPSTTVGMTNLGVRPTPRKFGGSTDRPVSKFEAYPIVTVSTSFSFSFSISYLVIPTGASALFADAEWRDLSCFCSALLSREERSLHFGRDDTRLESPGTTAHPRSITTALIRVPSGKSLVCRKISANSE
jgi:hypothetical protein